jgi:hypothetical protein
MSRGYRIQLPLEVARGTVTGEDELCVALDLMPILPEQEMGALVDEELKRRGWKKNKEGELVKELENGATATLGADRKTVTVSMQTERTVTGSGTTKQEADAAVRRAQDEAAAQTKLDATKALTKLEPGVRGELDDVVQRVYVEALKKKAASMGQVESMEESKGADGSLEITIKVKA